MQNFHIECNISILNATFLYGILLFNTSKEGHFYIKSLHFTLYSMSSAVCCSVLQCVAGNILYKIPIFRNK